MSFNKFEVILALKNKKSNKLCVLITVIFLFFKGLKIKPFFIEIISIFLKHIADGVIHK